ncbi:MAG: pectin acetylesterase-family hydrolase [Actinomycetota bacterium]
MSRLRSCLIAMAVLAPIAACSDSQAKVDVGTAPVATETTATAAPVTEAPTNAAHTTAAAAKVWDAITAPADCMCSDGSGFEFFVHKGDPAKVVFYLEGGGACFDPSTCGPDSKSFKRTVGHDDDLADLKTGIFDFENPANPFADWSVVFVPYCTGDVHIGNATTDYGNGTIIEHKGYVNGTTALNATKDLFPNATQLFVTGESAGSVPTPLYAGLGRDLFPAATIKVLADGSGAYPDIPGINAVIGQFWGTMNAVPDWTVNEGMTVEEWSLPGLFVQAGKHAPDIVFARHDYAFDKTQVFFGQLAGIPADDLVSLIDENETQIEAGGVELFSYISPGDSHTVLSRPEFYTETLNGTLLVDWVMALVKGQPIDDVHCDVCTV